MHSLLSFSFVAFSLSFVAFSFFCSQNSLLLCAFASPFACIFSKSDSTDFKSELMAKIVLNCYHFYFMKIICGLFLCIFSCFVVLKGLVSVFASDVRNCALRQCARSSAAGAAPKYSKPAHFSDISTYHGPPETDAEKTTKVIFAKDERPCTVRNHMTCLFVRTVKSESSFEGFPLRNIHQVAVLFCWLGFKFVLSCFGPCSS